MAHHDSEENLSIEQTDFNDYIRRGDDFVKIQIYKNAIKWYEKAATMGINDSIALKKAMQRKS